MSKPLNQQLEELFNRVAAVEARPQASAPDADVISDINNRLAEIGKRLEATEVAAANKAEAEEAELNRRAGEKAAQIVAAQGVQPVNEVPTEQPAQMTAEQAWARYNSIPSTNPKARTAFYRAHRELLSQPV